MQHEELCRIEGTSLKILEIPLSTIYEIIMATARCYTKSGSVEKYESNLWSNLGSGHWSSMDIAGTVSTPDSNGNYTVTQNQKYEDSDTTTEYYCHTKYNNIEKKFYFKKKIIKINIRVYKTGYNDYQGKLVFNCDISSNTTYDRLNDLITNVSISISWEVVNADSSTGIVGSYNTRIYTFGSMLLETGLKYDYQGRYYINAQKLTVNPSSGTYDETTWEASIY